MKTIYSYLLVMLITCTAHLAFAQSTNTFRIKISGNQYSDELIVRFINGASVNYDASYDAWKLFSPNPAVPSIYTRIAVGQELAINSLPEFDNDVSIPIYTRIPASGNYTISFEQIYPVTPAYRLSLTDELNNSHLELTGDTSFTIPMLTQQDVHAFSLNLSTTPGVMVKDEACYGQQDGAISVVKQGNDDWTARIFDTNNALVHSSTYQVDSTYINMMVPGDYGLTIESKGIIDTLPFTINAAAKIDASFQLSNDTLNLFNGAQLNVVNSSTAGLGQLWNFGDGNTDTVYSPNYAYQQVGNYQLSLTVGKRNALGGLDCAVDTSCTLVVVNDPLTTGIDPSEQGNLSTTPKGKGQFEWIDHQPSLKVLRIFNLYGQQVLEKKLQISHLNLDLRHLNTGCYILCVSHKNQAIAVKKIKI